MNCQIIFEMIASDAAQNDLANGLFQSKTGAILREKGVSRENNSRRKNYT
jgi:hypothetical protein